jgi:hypothetical protein
LWVRSLTMASPATTGWSTVFCIKINCNELIFTLLESWLSFYCLPLRTEWSGSHRLLASTLVARDLYPCKHVLLSSFWVSLQCHWCYCRVIHSYEASLAWILFENSWWVPTADCCNKRISTLFSINLTASTASINTTVSL